MAESVQGNEALLLDRKPKRDSRSSADKLPFSIESVDAFFEKHRGEISDTLEEQQINEQRESIKGVAQELSSAMRDLLEIISAREVFVHSRDIRDPKMKELYEHYREIERYAVIITKKIEAQGINYFMTDEGYNENFVRDIEMLLEVMIKGCPAIDIGGDVENPENEIGNIVREKEDIYGDQYRIDPLGVDREWEANNIVILNKSLSKGQADLETISQKIYRLAAGMTHSQRDGAGNYKSVIELVNTSPSGCRTIANHRRVIDCMNDKPLNQFEVMTRITARQIRAAVNTSLARTQIIKFNGLSRESGQVLNAFNSF